MAVARMRWDRRPGDLEGVHAVSRAWRTTPFAVLPLAGGQDARCAGCVGESVIGVPEFAGASGTIGGLAMARSLRRAS